jgi:hypothetical protein
MKLNKSSNSHFRNLNKRSPLSRRQQREKKSSKNLFWISNIGTEEVEELTRVEGTCLTIIPTSEYFSNKVNLIPYYILNEEAKERLSRHISRVLSGNPVDYKSPFVFLINKVIGTSDSEMNLREPIVAYFKSFLDGSQTVLNSLALLAREYKELEKIGTTSISLPWNFVTSDGRGKRINAQAYYSFKKTSFNSEDLNLSIERVIDRVKSDIPLIRTDLYEALRLSEKTTNWGLPLWLRGNEPFGDGYVYDIHYKIALELESRRLPFFKSLCVLVERVQPNGTDEPKQRAAMAFPHYITLLESTFQIPLLAHLRKFEGFEEYKSRSSANEKITTMLQRANLLLLILGFDGESFDTNIIRDLLDGAYDVVKSLFPVETHWLIEELKLQNIEADWITPDGVYTGRVEGMSSGCALTNIIDTLVQYILIEYCAIRLDLDEADRNLIKKIMNGDDGNWQVPSLTKKLMVIFCGELGMPINFAKALEETDFTEFCQRYYENSIDFIDQFGVCKDIRSISRTVGSILSFERKPDPEFKSGFYSLRVIGQTEDTANHPLFAKFIDLLVQSDKDNGLGTLYSGGTSNFIRSLSRGGFGTFEKLAEMERANSYDREKAKKLDTKLISLRVVEYLDRLGGR